VAGDLLRPRLERRGERTSVLDDRDVGRAQGGERTRQVGQLAGVELDRAHVGGQPRRGPARDEEDVRARVHPRRLCGGAGRGRHHEVRVRGLVHPAGADHLDGVLDAGRELRRAVHELDAHRHDRRRRRRAEVGAAARRDGDQRDERRDRPRHAARGK
jgi:hypothetical protein